MRDDRSARYQGLIPPHDDQLERDLTRSFRPLCDAGASANPSGEAGSR